MKLPSLLLLLSFVLVYPSFTSFAKAAKAPDDGLRPVPFTEVDVKPTPKKPVRIRFPGTVRKKGETPEIVLRFVVTRQGDVKRLVIVRFSHPDMIEPAMDAYEAAKFTPGLKEGQPVDTMMEVTELYSPK